MFSNQTTITFYQTVADNAWMFTVYVTKVAPTVPTEVHALYGLHMLIKYHLAHASKEDSITWTGNDVTLRFVCETKKEDLTQSETDRLYACVVSHAQHFGVNSVPRVIM